MSTDREIHRDIDDEDRERVSGERPTFIIQDPPSQITITFNFPMVARLVEMMDDFEELEPDLFTLREKLRYIAENRVMPARDNRDAPRREFRRVPRRY